jgi:hypothetical protein
VRSDEMINGHFFSVLEKTRQSTLVFLITATTIVTSFRRASGVVLNFDDLPESHSLLGTNYAGLIWEAGDVGVDGKIGYWATPSVFSGYPHSPPRNIINAADSTQIGITFPSPVDLRGAYIGKQGNYGEAQGVYVNGYADGNFVAGTALLTNLSTTPVWLDMSALTGVDRIVFIAIPSGNGAIYGVDDLTFTYVPEPASLSLLALGGLLLRRGRVP